MTFSGYVMDFILAVVYEHTPFWISAGTNMGDVELP